MSTTLTQLIDQCEADLDDSGNAIWSAADIERWLRDAIADYSAHFPRFISDDITLTTDDREYYLESDFVSMISVEYPNTNDPKTYLQRRPYTHPDFWSEDGYYDIVPHEGDTTPNEIFISTKPTTGEELTILYQANHNIIAAVGTPTTVPAIHHRLLRQYVLWQAANQLKVAEEATPTSNSSLLMSQLGINVDRARRAYVDSLAKALYTVSNSAVISWKAQTKETRRIY